MSGRASRYEILVTRLLGLSLLLFGSLFVALGGQRFARYRQTAGWRAVPGEMISLPPQRRYSYRVGGAIHHGTRARLEGGRSRPPSAGPALGRDSGRAAITIHYDPEHPESAVLERESLAPGVLLAVAGLAPILGGAFLLRRRRAATTSRGAVVRRMGVE